MIESILPHDQASGLRRLFEKRTTPIIAFTSTQGNSGHLSDRSRVIMQLAGDLLAAGHSVTLFDEHPAPGSIANAYGVSMRKDLKQALNGDYPLEEVISRPVQGLSLIAAARAAGMEFSIADEASLEGNLTLLRNGSDCVMIDGVHRAGRMLSPLAACADQLIVVMRGDKDDLMPAYRLIKRVVHENAALPIGVIAVHAADAQQAKTSYETLRRVAHEHLGVHLQYQGTALTADARCLPLIQPGVDLTRRARSKSKGDSAGMAGRRGIADSVV